VQASHQPTGRHGECPKLTRQLGGRRARPKCMGDMRGAYRRRKKGVDPLRRLRPRRRGRQAAGQILAQLRQPRRREKARARKQGPPRRKVWPL
jgi:hypothetical protein